MNIKELRAKLDQYTKSARQLLEDSTQLNSEGKTEEAAAKFGTYQEYLEKAKTVKSQIEAAMELDGLTVEEPTAVPEAPATKSEPVRLPFSDADTDVDAPTKSEPVVEDGFNKPTYVLRFGEEDAAVKAIIKDVYGTNYADSRVNQQRAFNKYVRFGHTRLEREEERLLKTLILLPEQLREDVKADVSVATIKATLQESLNDLGGYLVPEDYRASMVKRLRDMTVIRQNARVVTTNRDAVEYPKLEGGNNRYTSAVRVTWVDEVPSDANVALTNPTFGMIRVPVHTVMARTDISRNMLEDSAFDVISVVSELFAEAAAIDEDEKFITGQGGGTPFGILGERLGTTASPVAGVESIVTGASSTLQADGLIDLVYGLPAQYRGNAKLVSARTTMRDIRKLKDSDGRYYWEPSYQAGQPGMVLGFPALESESVPTLGVNEYPILFGDLTGYLVVDRVGMTIERVEDVTTVGTNKVALFMRRRLGGQVIEPWKVKVQKVSA